MAEAAAVVLESAQIPTPVDVPGDDAPVKRIDTRGLKALGQQLGSTFGQYRADRVIQEQRWLRNLRQYLGFYDPEVERYLTPERSRAYPKMTRVKCISMLSRIMDLMFPSDDSNWTIAARPSADMAIADVKQAIADAMEADQAAGGGNGPEVDDAYVQAAVMALAQKRAARLAEEIEDQLQELGGDQSYDYIALNKEVVTSGILFGVGVLCGPFAREVRTASWVFDPKTKQPKAQAKTTYMPQFEFVRCWDYYPDMGAKRLEDGDGYFLRRVMSKRQVRDLADREDFFGDVLKGYLKSYPQGNYKAQAFEGELRTMGTKANVNEQKSDGCKYEIISWHGPVDGHYLRMAGVEVDDDRLADQIDAEIWMLADYVVKAVMNPWVELGHAVKTSHAFVFDHDDSAPIGFGLPNIMRDTQMSISAATRMMLDNASVVCGPILELNTSVMQAGQDLTSIHAYKTFYRDDDGATAQFAAVREIKVDSHIPDLEKIIELFMKFADLETFVGPANGGDMTQMPSEPMRNAAGASMMMGHAALPFKDIIRNFDRFTQSVIQALVSFNRLLNPHVAQVAEYDVVARGATSLIAKEVRGMQVDALATSLTPEEKMHVDTRKLVKARFDVRDLGDMLVSEAEVARRQAAADKQTQDQQDLATRTAEATIRKLLADAFKGLTQGQKNQAMANVQQVDAALDVMERDSKGALTHAQTVKTHADTATALGALAPPTQGAPDGDPADSPDDPSQGGGAAGPAAGGPDQPGAGLPPGAAPALAAPGGGGPGLLPPGGLPGAPGQGAGLSIPPA